MPDLSAIGRVLIGIGLVTLLIGLLLVWGGKYFPLGRLPGDIVIQRGGFTFFFPIATSIILSLLLTIIFSLLRR